MGVTVKYFLLPFLISFVSSLIFFNLGIGELNKGTFLGLINNQEVLVTIIHSVVIFCLFLLAYKAEKFREEILLLLSGSLSNFLNRAVFEGVLDFFKLSIFYFNIADIIISYAIILIGIKFLKSFLSIKKESNFG
jgi:lipoprotein signal peptidase